jgi:hypothetical protein
MYVNVSLQDSFMLSVIQTSQLQEVLFIHQFIGQFGKYRQLKMEQASKDSLRPRIMHPYMMCSITLFPI